MNRERVVRLIEILKEVEKKKLPFNMDKWFMTWEKAHDCGTAACALGWSARDLEFQKEGLTINPDYMVIEYDNEHDSFAGAKFFGLPPKTFLPSTYLPDSFDPENPDIDLLDIAISTVIDHLENLLAQDQIP